MKSSFSLSGSAASGDTDAREANPAFCKNFLLDWSSM
jgi:hypothetical protein